MSGSFDLLGADEPMEDSGESSGEEEEVREEEEEEEEEEEPVKMKPATPRTPLHRSWTIWFSRRARGQAKIKWDSHVKAIGDFETVEEFWGLYCHLERPQDLKAGGEFHLFVKGIKPAWEDPSNVNGGKWVLRLKKGLVTKLWEDLVLAMVGEQLVEDPSSLCGAVVSLRNLEDMISVWNKDSEDKDIILKIRDAMIRVMDLPVDTQMEYKVHNKSMQALASKEDEDRE